MIPRTPTLHAALRDVLNPGVDFFPGLFGGHGPGFGWHAGGDVPEPEQLALSELVVVHLVVTVPACVRGEIGCACRLTEQGRLLLSIWDAQSPVPHVIGVHPACGTGSNEEGQ